MITGGKHPVDSKNRKRKLKSWEAIMKTLRDKLDSNKCVSMPADYEVQSNHVTNFNAGAW